MIRPASIDIAKDFLRVAEGLWLTPKHDIAGVLTNGYGNTKNVPNNSITKEKAEEDLEDNCVCAATLLSSKINQNVLKGLTDHEQAALICFAFNVGVGNWNIWKLLNSGRLEEVPAELARFNHARVKGKLVEVDGLTNRRNAEIKLWNTRDTMLTSGCKENQVAHFAGTFAMPPHDATSPTCSNAMQVEPKPDPAKQVKANIGMTAVTTSVAGSAVALAGYKFGLSPLTVHILVGFCIGCVVILAIAILLYLKSPKTKPAQLRELVLKLDAKDVQGTLDMASAAFNSALQNLKDAYEKKVAAAQTNASQAATDLQSANEKIAELQQQVEALKNAAQAVDDEDTAQVIAAIPQD